MAEGRKITLNPKKRRRKITPDPKRRNGGKLPYILKDGMAENYPKS